MFQGEMGIKASSDWIGCKDLKQGDAQTKTLAVTEATTILRLHFYQQQNLVKKISKKIS